MKISIYTTLISAAPLREKRYSVKALATPGCGMMSNLNNTDHEGVVHSMLPWLQGSDDFRAWITDAETDDPVLGIEKSQGLLLFNCAETVGTLLFVEFQKALFGNRIMNIETL